MTTKVRIGNKSRKYLADSKLGMSYDDRLKRTRLDVKKGSLELIDCGNGYTKIVR